MAVQKTPDRLKKKKAIENLSAPRITQDQKATTRIVNNTGKTEYDY